MGMVAYVRVCVGVWGVCEHVSAYVPLLVRSCVRVYVWAGEGGRVLETFCEGGGVAACVPNSVHAGACVHVSKCMRRKCAKERAGRDGMGEGGSVDASYYLRGQEVLGIKYV